jgi:hypothetical protein
LHNTSIRNAQGQLPKDLIKQQKHIVYLNSRWERRKSFLLFLRETGLASDDSVSMGRRGLLLGLLLGGQVHLPMLRVMETRKLQQRITSYL